jgi:hypothetical protein
MPGPRLLPSRRLAAAATVVAAVAAVAAWPSAAQAPVAKISYGVADDGAKYAEDGGTWFYGQLAGAGMTEVRWSLQWDPGAPSAIKELPFLARAAPVARAAGIRVVLSLTSTVPRRHDPTAFCGWAGLVARTVAQWGIRDFIVWNEPNTRRFWVPQLDGRGRDVAAAAYVRLLATCYDTLKAANRSANVIGFGLSPRASTPASNEPLPFLRDVGLAYRKTSRSQPGRGKPLMDELAIHPYPNPNSPADAPSVGYRDPRRFGIPDLARVKQAVYDAFDGTAQSTTISPRTPLRLMVDEIGWQVDTTGLPNYYGRENVKTISAARQAQYLDTMVSRYLACDPAVTDVLLFLLQDEASRDGRELIVPTGPAVPGQAPPTETATTTTTTDTTTTTTTTATTTPSTTATDTTPATTTTDTTTTAVADTTTATTTAVSTVAQGPTPAPTPPSPIFGPQVSGGWQSGLLTYGAPDQVQRRPGYATMARAAAAGRRACRATPIVWRPA